MPIIEKFHEAVKNNDIKTVRSLITKEGVEVNARQPNNNNLPAILIAAQKGFLEMVQTLVALGADVNIKARTGSTALMESAHRGHQAIVEFLFKNGAIVYEASFGFLATATESNNINIVRLCLDNKADVNYKSDLGYTALAMAAQNHNTDIIKLLFERGSYKNFPMDPKGAEENALMCAIWRSTEEENTENSGFLRSMTTDTLARAKKLLCEKLNESTYLPETINKLTSDYVAPKTPCRDTIALLIKNGMEINDRNGDGASALSYATTKKQKDIVISLVEAGARISSSTPGRYQNDINREITEYCEEEKINMPKI